LLNQVVVVISILPSGRAASSPQRNCVWRYLTSFDSRLRRDRTSQGCLCGDWFIFYFFRLMKFASENQGMSVKNCGVFEERSDEFPQFSE
jgi:hypothetical protein